MATFMRFSQALVQGQPVKMNLSKQMAILSISSIRSMNPLSYFPNELPRPPLQIPKDIRAYSSSATDSAISTESTNSTIEPSTCDPATALSKAFDPDLVDSLFQKMNGDLPLPEMSDPYVKDYPRCFLCKENVKLDHKNVRLLSQFVSPYTGRIYGRAVTGLCIPMQKHVSKLINRSRKSGYMPFILKDPRYLQDPQPFDPMAHRKRAN